MPVEISFSPLNGFPKAPTEDRKRSQFDTSHAQTIKLLRAELEKLSAEQVYVQIDVAATRIRRDGLPMEDAVAKTPSVVVAFESRHGPMMYACDTFTRWQDNLRAIALGLEALRMVDRYGITRSGEQYRGFKALTTSADLESTDHAAQVIYHYAEADNTADMIKTNKAAYLRWLPTALQKAHPDHGGKAEQLDKVLEARRRLDAHHKVKR